MTASDAVLVVRTHQVAACTYTSKPFFMMSVHVPLQNAHKPLTDVDRLKGFQLAPSTHLDEHIFCEVAGTLFEALIAGQRDLWTLVFSSPYTSTSPATSTSLLMSTPQARRKHCKSGKGKGRIFRKQSERKKFTYEVMTSDNAIEGRIKCVRWTRCHFKLESSCTEKFSWVWLKNWYVQTSRIVSDGLAPVSLCFN